MKTLRTVQNGTVIALAVVALVTGCGKKAEEAAAPDSTTTAPSTTPTAPAAPTAPPTTPTTPPSSSTVPAPGDTTGTAPGSSTAPDSTTSGTTGTSPGGTGTGTTTPGTDTTSPGTGGTGTGTGTGTGGRSSLDPSFGRLAAASPAVIRGLYGVEITRVADAKDATTKDMKDAAKDEGKEVKKEAKDSKLSRSDKNFLEEAAVDGLYEVEVGKIASERASDPGVKSFAQTLVTHHAAANDELKQLAAARNVEIPAELPMMKRRSLDKLRKTASGEFDKEFVNKVVIKNHEKDIKRFEKASRDAKDPEVRAWAEKTLPALRQHLSDARNLMSGSGQGTPGAGKSSGSGRSGSSSGASGATGPSPTSRLELPTPVC